MKPVVPREQANRDVDAAIAHDLEEVSPAVAVGFIDALERAYTHISRHPGKGSPRSGHELDLPDLRSWRLSRYATPTWSFTSNARTTSMSGAYCTANATFPRGCRPRTPSPDPSARNATDPSSRPTRRRAVPAVATGRSETSTFRSGRAKRVWSSRSGRTETLPAPNPRWGAANRRWRSRPDAKETFITPMFPRQIPSR